MCSAMPTSLVSAGTMKTLVLGCEETLHRLEKELSDFLREGSASQ
jgi:hypothetical protein